MFSKIGFISFFLFLLRLSLFAQAVENDSLKKVELWYDDDYQVRRLKSVFYVLEDDHDVMHGKMVSFYESGKVISEGYYELNEPVGEWKYYFEGGAIKMIAHLENSEKGYWKYYFENGGLKQEGRIENNKQIGTWKYYFENGILKSKGVYKQGIKDGEWNYFFEDGSIKAEALYSNGKGYYREYYANGNVKTEGETVNNQSEGEWKYYYPSGKLQAKGYELHGVKNGHWEYYFENGQKSSEGNYVDGKQHDSWKYYYENGVVSSEGAHYEGNKDGNWKLFHKDGAFKGDGVFKRGDGEYKEYYESGVLRIKGAVKQNKNNGLWQYFYEDGTLQGECTFVQGKGEYSGYYKGGQLKMKGTIEDNLKVGVWELYKENGSLAGYYKTLYDDKGEEVFQADSSDSDIKIRVDTLSSAQEEIRLPDYRYKPKKKSKLKWFNPKLHEYEGIIVGANPLGFVNANFPVSVEYYYQERLGFEMEYTIFRNPFFLADSKIPNNIVYNRGQAIDFAQRLYEPAKSYGMIYFGHRARFKTNLFTATVNDTADFVFAEEKISARENSIEYLFFVGNRVFNRGYKHPGFTFDIFITAGVGYRWFLKQYTETPIRERLFSGIPQKNIFIPYRLEFSFGYLF